MENQEAIEQLANAYGISAQDAANLIQRFCAAVGSVKEAIMDIFEALRSSIEEIWTEIDAKNETGAPMSLCEFICLMNEAHRRAIEEEKKPPDSKSNTGQADNAGLDGGPVSR